MTPPPELVRAWDGWPCYALAPDGRRCLAWGTGGLMLITRGRYATAVDCDAPAAEPWMRCPHVLREGEGRSWRCQLHAGHQHRQHPTRCRSITGHRSWLPSTAPATVDAGHSGQGAEHPHLGALVTPSATTTQETQPCP